MKSTGTFSIRGRFASLFYEEILAALVVIAAIGVVLSLELSF